MACGHEIENSNAAQYSYYSSDRGKTWSTLKSVLSEGNLSQYANTQTWIVSAVSHYPDWTNYITLTPASGTVKPSEAQKVYVAPEKVKLINPKITADGYKIGTRGFTNYILSADDMVKA